MILIPLIIIFLLPIAFIIINFNRKAYNEQNKKVDYELKNQFCVASLAKLRIANHSKDVEKSLDHANEFFNLFGIKFTYDPKKEK